ncbi:MAG TPA: aminodeoxychorismate lyase, partial [Planctomycetes bacterium]|nr:aminodeoxychorismate lyase [Planctomycetota bacterium]
PHPWNTYVIPGIPPSPIAGPGQAAIDAVLWPKETKDLFFVSRNDGTHHFSETYAEHARMVRKFQSRR